MNIEERNELYEKIFKEIEKYKFTGYSDEVVFREGNVDPWSIDVYSYPAYPEEELTDEDCYQGTIYVEEDGIHWEGEIIKDINELFNRLGL